MLVVLVVILHDIDRLPDLLKAWKEIGVPGVTLLQSIGGFQAEAWVKRTGLGGLLSLFEHSKSQQRTLISLIDDQEMLGRAISEADRVVKGFDRPHSGILFTIPAGQALGLQKWDLPRLDEVEELEKVPVRDHSEANLLGWFEEDVRSTFGEEALSDWSKQRGTLVSEITHLRNLKPSIVKMDTPLRELLSKFLDNPFVTTVCVTNQEERLMGLVDVSSLSEAMLTPVVPEEFIKDPNGYQRALKFANVNGKYIAADLMREPVYVFHTDTLDKTFHQMKEHHLSGLPVVDEHYHVAGFVTLTELMAVCYPSREDEK